MAGKSSPRRRTAVVERLVERLRSANTGWRGKVTVIATMRLLLMLSILAGNSVIRADDGWQRKRTAHRPGMSTLVQTDLSALGAKLARRLATSAQPAAKATTPDSWRLHWRNERNTPAFIQTSMASVNVPASKPMPSRSVRAPSAMALDVLVAHPEIFGLQHPRDELRHLETVRGTDGRLRVRFARREQGVPVWGEDLVVHLDANGQMFAFNGVYSGTQSKAVRTPQITAAEALRQVREHLGARQSLEPLTDPWSGLLNYEGPTVELMQRPDAVGRYQPVWRVEIRPSLRDLWVYAVDAHSGEIVERYNATPWDGPATATAVDLAGVARQLQVHAVADSFVLIDGSRPIFALIQPDLLGNPQGALVTLSAGRQDLSRTTQVDLVISGDNSWDDPVAVSAHTNMGIVFDYFLQTHGRLSIDGVGGSMYSIIHVTDKGLAMDNAFWSGTFMAYGDGREAFSPLAGGLDVAAHEMTHGVIQHTVNLEYRNQSGALNESLADVFGAMVDRRNWLLGEDVVTSTRIFASGALRDMADPHNGAAPGGNGWQPSHMAEFRELPLATDNGGVHVNSGIPNRACFLLAEAIGREKTERIYYHILASRLINQRGNFVDMRNAALQAATELYGDQEVTAVETAFATVGIIGEEGYQPPERRAVVPGEEWLLVVGAQAGDRGLYLVRTELQSEEDIVLLTPTPVYDRTGNSVSVSADGAFVLFVDAANNLRVVNIDGSDERVLSDTRDWKSISLSPDGSKLAATTMFQEGMIVLLDLVDSEQSKAIPLKRPTTQEGVTTSVVRFADALDWDPAGEFLIYDAYNAIPRGTGDSLSFWDVTLLEPEEEFFVPLFPPQIEGVQLGNPTIARASGRHVVFDRFDSREGVKSNEVWVYDLVTGDKGMIVSTGSAIAFPTFSADDTELIYQRRDRFGADVVARIPLDESHLRAAGEEQVFLTGAKIPNWLVIADEEDPTTSVGQTHEGATTPATYELLGSYPNPFNPTTTIRFQLATAAMVDLSIFDVRGALVARLLRQERIAGEHSATWEGLDQGGRAVASGVYLARLRVRVGSRWIQNQTQRMTLLR
ncbi:MAG TPA: hypothetical protein DIC52_03480 [Candidatus Latescibacteria bacterium]|nr:hypothetical protein [Candidatus Latescibacterota bacterium]